MTKPGRIVGLAAGLYSAMLGVGLVWGLLRGLLPEWWDYPGPFDDAGPTPWTAIALGAGLGLLGVALSYALERTVEGVRRLGDRFGMVLAGVGWREALALALFSSVGEEVLFRGCLQSEIGLVPATLLFALVHVGPERVYLWWTASAFVFGLGLGVLYESQGGLLGPIVMHFVINAINITLLGRKAAAKNADARPLGTMPPV
ncbi:MAG: CPBP family intramembrane metalloprotease [Deltaproteobacteria bacterium]|nr:CPBP family intramembrane metalloprotease [Deltaproteobacteria bacterium]